MTKEKLLIIGGPTAVGKTKLSIELAKTLNGEIISADSMQIYKGMDIGSAKIKEEEKEGVKHYLIDVVSPDEPFTVSDYKRLGEEAILAISNKGRLPIIVGGTGLYINALSCNMTFTEGAKDDNLRRELEELSLTKGREYLHNLLEKVDKPSADKIHYNNVKRVIRALEVFKLTGKPFSQYNLGKDMYESNYDVYYYVLTMDRNKLYKRIDKRVLMMFDEGLLEECIKLKELGYNSLMQSMQGIGYKEVLSYLEGNISLERCIEMVQQGSRNYAKRQLTWFRRDPRVKFIDVDNEPIEAVIKKIQRDING